MLKKNVTYEDFNGDSVTETFYFNLSKAELLELEVGFQGGLAETIQKIVKTNDNKTLFDIFKKIVLMSYGVKSDDGRRFIKNDTLREEFMQTAAFDTIFMELATNDKAAADFINGIVPKDLGEAVAQEMTKTQESLPNADNDSSSTTPN